ncbi:enoyl-CoA hydratase [compost metagenome]
MAATGWCAQPLPPNLLQEQVTHSVKRIANLAPQAARLNKQAMRSLASDGAVIAPYAYATSAEHREGVMAFLDKRPPNFLNAEI